MARYVGTSVQKNEKEGSKKPSSRHFSIYDLKGVKRQIKTIFDACEQGDHRAIMGFAKHKDFDIDAKDRYGRTALIWASDCGHLHICESLIRLNASINITDTHTGRTAIHWASRTGSLPIVRLLVQYGANINKEDRFGLTPLYLAKTRGSEGEKVFQYLLSEGAIYNEMEPFHVTAIEDRIKAQMEELEEMPADENAKP